MYLVPSFYKPVDVHACTPSEPFTEDAALAAKRPQGKENSASRIDGPGPFANRGTMRPTSTATLVERAKDGSGEAWEELVARYGGIIVATGAYYRLGPADIAALQQATWLRLVEALHGSEHPVSVRRWLATTARRESLHLLKRAGGHRPPSTTNWPTGPALDGLGGRAQEKVYERSMK
jgi:Sigma-70 region 2